MADNQENLTDETSDEISISYRMMNFPNEADPGDEDNEGIVEYLDIDLENTMRVQDTEEEYCFSQVSPATPSIARQSVLKKNYGIPPKRSNIPKRKSTLGKSTKNPKTIQMNTTSSMEHDLNSVKRTSKRKATLESASVHAAVDEINAKLLAASANFANDYVLNKNTEKLAVLDSPVKFEIDEPNKQLELDSLDLFFQSMAHTVMTLPAAVQAKIKMDICKVIATAEMKYSTLDISQEFD